MTQQPLILIREIDATRLASILTELAELESETGAHLTAGDVLRRAVGRALPSSFTELQPEAITVHDFGPNGIDQVIAPVESEHAASLAIGAIKPRPFEVEGRLVLCPTLILAMAADPTRLGGEQAIQLLTAICRSLERPLSLCAR